VEISKYNRKGSLIPMQINEIKDIFRIHLSSTEMKVFTDVKEETPI
jgi:hypothetical protein